MEHMEKETSKEIFHYNLFWQGRQNKEERELGHDNCYLVKEE
jgi:hypothetical protein